LAEDLVRSGEIPDLMNSKCNGGGGGTQGQAPGCSDISDADRVAQ
jgi:hypothetical protein